jgi:hypothetical protein
MKTKRFRLPSPPMVVALLALFVALGGTSYALTKKDKKKVRNIATAVSTATANQKVFGATSTEAGAISSATLPGTTVSRNGNNYRYTFPRSVAGCVPAGVGSANGVVAAVIAPPNGVDVGPNGGGANSVIVVCP